MRILTYVATLMAGVSDRLRTLVAPSAPSAPSTSSTSSARGQEPDTCPIGQPDCGTTPK